MAEAKKEPTGATPSVDPQALFAKIEAIIQKNSQPAPSPGPATAPEQGSKTSKSWVAGIIIVAVVLVAIAVWAWISWRRNKELADLRHEKEKQRILAEKAAADFKVAANTAIAKQAQAQLEVIREEQRRVDADLRVEEQRYEADLHTIDRIVSWRDIPGESG